MSSNRSTSVVAPPAQTHPTPIDFVQPLALRSMFWRPEYLEKSAWIEHIPFAFWLVEALRPKVFVELGVHYGTSYFAFCQAVDRLELDTQCFGIDTWKGDAHSGTYDESVYRQTALHNEKRYSGFSRLVRSTFDDGAKYFSDGSIDLLHIDGLHTVEAVRHDFNTWLPKLAKGAVVILHDTNVRERGFGVFKFFEELKESYPTFEFVHGHGLGVVTIGDDNSESLRHLIRAGLEEATNRQVQEIFSRLGRACMDAYIATTQSEHALRIDVELSKSKQVIDEITATARQASLDLQRRSEEVAQLQLKFSEQIERHSIERGQLAERASLFQSLREELKQELEAQRANSERLMLEIARIESERHKIEESDRRNRRAIEDRDQLFKKLNDDHRASEEKLNVTSAALERLQDVHAECNKTSFMAEATIHNLNSEVTSLKAEIENLGELLERSEKRAGQSATEVELLGTKVTELETANRGIQQQLTQSEQKIADLERDCSTVIDERDANLASIAALNLTNTKQVAVIEELSSKTQDYENEQVRLSLLLSAHQDKLRCTEEKLREAENGTKELSEQVARLKDINISLLTQSNTANDQLAESLTTIDGLTSENESLRKDLDQLKVTLSENQECQHVAIRWKQQHDELLSENLKLRSSIDERFGEITQLTQMIDSIKATSVQDRKNATETKKQLDQYKKLANEQKKNIEQMRAQEVDLRSLLNSEQAENKSAREAASKESARLLQEHRTSRLHLEKLVANLREDLAVAKKASAKERTSSQANNQRAEAELNDVKSSAAASEKLIADLKAENDQLLAKNRELQSNIELRFDEIAQLSAIIAAETSKKSGGPEESFSAKIQSAPASDVSKHGKLPRLSNVEIIEQSSFFNAEWYLTAYKKVKRSRLAPAEHYLKAGGEGYDPGPEFSSARYLEDHPDVAMSGMNPLLHYILFGCAEGRVIHPSEAIKNG